MVLNHKKYARPFAGAHFYGSGLDNFLSELDISQSGFVRA